MVLEERHGFVFCLPHYLHHSPLILHRSLAWTAPVPALNDRLRLHVSLYSMEIDLNQRLKFTKSAHQACSFPPLFPVFLPRARLLW